MSEVAGEAKRLDVIAMGAHPDDVELGCGGTLALLAERGLRVGIVHLTRGEAGTRGTEDERIAEACHAASELGAVWVDYLNCGDGGLRTGEAEENAVIEILRRSRPELVFAPSPTDRHPDHGRASQLVEAACFYSGLRRRAPELGEAHRPAAVFNYMQHDPFAPRFVVDVTRTWSKKMRALAAYGSQLHQPGNDVSVREEPMTKIASPEFAAAIEGRARHYGILIGCAFAEPFGSRLPLAVGDPWELLPKGLR